MKKTNLTIPFEDEKLKALRLFAGKKDADIEAEVDDAVQKLYEKYVPKDARELVELMAGGDMPKAKTAEKKAALPKVATKPEPAKNGATNLGSTQASGASSNFSDRTGSDKA